MASFKICMNCSAENGLLRRVCRKCGKGQGRSFFREPTCEEVSAHDKAESNVRETLRRFEMEAA